MNSLLSRPVEYPLRRHSNATALREENGCLAALFFFLCVFCVLARNVTDWGQNPRNGSFFFFFSLLGVSLGASFVALFCAGCTGDCPPSPTTALHRRFRYGCDAMPSSGTAKEAYFRVVLDGKKHELHVIQHSLAKTTRR
ncbi:hypothetical protein V8C35DRAFT_307342 [Trichoderma chlorosporum]